MEEEKNQNEMWLMEENTFLDFFYLSSSCSERLKTSKAYMR